MSRKYKFRDNDKLYFVSFAVINWIDLVEVLPGNTTNLQSFLNRTPVTDQAKAYLNWVLFDEQLKYVSSGADPVQVNGGYKLHDVFINTPVSVTKNGFLYVFVSNESNLPVYFDNLAITHTYGPILEETHYYPFGLTMAGISSKAAGSIENKRKFNDGTDLESKEFSDGSGLELYSTAYRSYDPQLGRFHQIDPWAELSTNYSAYAYCMNNPLRYNDPLGLDTVGTTTNGNKMNIPKNANDGDVLKITNPDGSTSYYTYDPSNPNANSQGYVGSGMEAAPDQGVTVKAKAKPKDNSDIENANQALFVIGLSQDAAEELGGWNKAMNLLKEGKFQMVYNGELKTYNLNFHGNKSVPAQLVRINKTGFATTAVGNMAYYKALKAGGVVLNVAGILVSAWDMKRNGVNTGNVYDMGAGATAFIPGVGWYISTQMTINKMGIHEAMEMNPDWIGPPAF